MLLSEGVLMMPPHRYRTAPARAQDRYAAPKYVATQQMESDPGAEHQDADSISSRARATRRAQTAEPEKSCYFLAILRFLCLAAFAGAAGVAVAA